MLSHADFGRPDHALFARCPGFDRRRAAEILLARAEKEAEFPWNADLVELVGTLPAERIASRAAEDLGHGRAWRNRSSLCWQQPRAADREKFLHGLASPQLATVRSAWNRWRSSAARRMVREMLALVRAPRAACPTPGRKTSCRTDCPVSAAADRSGEAGRRQAGVDGLVREAHPALADKLGGVDGVDVAGWHKRLAN